MPNPFPKDAKTRLEETIAFIVTGGSEPTDQVAACGLIVGGLLSHWKDHPPAAWEVERVSTAMHLGSAGAKLDRQYRRAIILMRTALLRHEVSKASTEAKALVANDLPAEFDRVVCKAAEQKFEIPQRLLLQAKRARHQLLDQRLSRFLNKGQQVPDSLKSDYLEFEELTQEIAYLTNQRSNGTKLIYLPADAGNDWGLAANIQYLSYKQVLAGEGGLDSLDEGGELYLIGHGNFGTGIGRHDESYGAREIVSKLVSDALPLKPQEPVTVYVWACWGATHTRRALGLVGKREPFARRFAQALAEAGFTDYRVVGFAGSVANGNLYQDIVPGQENKDVGQAEHYVVYDVDRGDFNRVQGQDWTAKASLTLSGFAYSVRRRGGTNNAA